MTLFKQRINHILDFSQHGFAKHVSVFSEGNCCLPHRYHRNWPSTFFCVFFDGLHLSRRGRSPSLLAHFACCPIGHCSFPYFYTVHLSMAGSSLTGPTTIPFSNRINQPPATNCTKMTTSLPLPFHQSFFSFFSTVSSFWLPPVRSGGVGLLSNLYGFQAHHERSGVEVFPGDGQSAFVVVAFNLFSPHAVSRYALPFWMAILTASSFSFLSFWFLI
jgi:hypothetical protein